MQYKWKVVALLFCCAALNYGDRAVTTAIYPLFRSELGMSDVAMASVGSFFLWAYGLASPFAGMAADRFSRRLIIAGSLAAWSAVTLATGFATDVTQILITRVLLGLAECLYLPAAIALIADHHGPSSRATAIGLHTAGLSIGLVGGGWVSGYLGEHYGWQVPFRMLGAAGVLLSILTYTFLRDVPSERKIQQTGNLEILSLLRIPTLAIIVCEALLAAIANNIFINWLPLYFKESFGLSLATAGFSAGFLLQFSSTTGAAAGGVLSDRAARFDRRRRLLVQCLCYGVAAPLLLVFLFHAPLSTIAPAIATFGFLRAIGSANENPVLCDLLTPKMRSRAVGLMNATNCLAGGAGVFTAGVLKTSYGLGAVFAGSSVILLISSALLLLGYRRFSGSDLNRAAKQQSA